MLKKCLRRRRKLPARPAPEGSVCPVARREACALWALGPKAQSDPKRGSETMSATVREARMIEQPGHLPPKVAKRPEGGERNERWARPAPSAKIERPGKAGRYELTLEGTEGSVCPVGTCHRRWQSAPKVGSETSGGRGQCPPRRLSDRDGHGTRPKASGNPAHNGHSAGGPERAARANHHHSNWDGQAPPPHRSPQKRPTATASAGRVWDPPESERRPSP